MGTASFPREVLESISPAIRRLNDIGAVWVGAGNISPVFDWKVDLSDYFPQQEEIELPFLLLALTSQVQDCAYVIWLEIFKIIRVW